MKRGLPEIYIAGPLTSDDPSVMNGRRIAAADARAAVDALGVLRGWDPHNQVPQPPGLDGEALWNHAMLHCLTRLSRCQGVLMLPGWRASRGARMEHSLALAWGIPIHYSLADLRLSFGLAA